LWEGVLGAGISEADSEDLWFPYPFINMYNKNVIYKKNPVLKNVIICGVVSILNKTKYANNIMENA
jgi:hypothetical protein